MRRRIIPCLDIRNGRVVKGKKFVGIEDVDAPEKLAAYYNKSGADELVFFDITASNENRATSLDFIEKIAKELTIPFCVGGGIRTVADFQTFMGLGASKVSVNSAAVLNPSLISEASKQFGSSTVVLSIDTKKNGGGVYKIYVNGGREETDLEAVSWVKKGVALGAGEVVVNSIDEDGMKNGYDIGLLKEIGEAVDVPVVASGGAGTLEHFYEAAKETNATGLLAASVFHYGEIKIPELKDYLRRKGVDVV